MSKFTDKVKVIVGPAFGSNDDGKPAPDDLRGQFLAAGWTDDPGTGRAVHLPDGREVVNPVPFAPPIGHVAEPSLMELMDQRIQRHFARLADDAVIDSEDDVLDFDVGEEFDPFSMYEIVDLQDDHPAATMPETPPVEAAKPPENLEEKPPEIIPSDGNKS